MQARLGRLTSADFPRGGFLGARPIRPLFGRDAELTRLIAALDVVQTGQSRVLALVGEPGVGKTRLAQEASLIAVEREYRVLVGRCYEESASLPLFPFVEALSAGLATISDDLRQRARWPELQQLLNARRSTSAVHNLGHVDDARHDLFAAVSACIREVAGIAPVALLLDDVHWADSASLGLLAHLARDLAADPVLLLVTYRDVDAHDKAALSAAVQMLTRERRLDRISVRGLALEDTLQLVRAYLGVDSVPREFLDLVHGRTEGNAFFIEEVLCTLVERQLLAPSSGVWPAEAGVGTRGLPLPDSVRAAVEQRVERLGHRAHELLQLASVLGQEFDLPILLNAADAPEEEVLADLEAALNAHLIREQQAAHGGRYGFVHALVHQTLYEAQPLLRRRLHTRAAQAIERARGQRKDAAAELARHFLAGGDAERATRYSIAAGDHAAALYAHAEAARHYEQAIDLVLDGDDDARLADLRCKLAAELAYVDARDETIMSLYESALATYVQLHDGLGQARAHQGMAVALGAPGDLPHLEAALCLWPDEATPELARLLLHTVSATYVAGEYARATRLAERALAMAERLDDVSLQARALLESAGLEVWRSLDRALEILARAAPLARQAQDWRALTRINYLAGMFWQDAGNWERSRMARAEMAMAAEHERHMGRLAHGLRAVAFSSIQLGAWAEGRSVIARASEMDPRDTGILPGAAFRAWLEGQPESALNKLRTFIAAARDRNDFLTLLTGLSTLADWALQMDQVPEALDAATEGLELVKQRTWHSTAECAAPLAEALARLGVEGADERIAELEQLAAKYQKRVGDPQFLRARGILRHRAGDVPIAVETLQRSGEVALTQGALIERGRTLAVLADVAASAGDARLALDANAKLDEIMRGIGPEVGNLAWAKTRAAAAGVAVGPRYPDGLTQREVDVLRLVSAGNTNAEIAELLVLSVRTVERHVTNLYAKIGARGRADATAYALRHHLA